MGSILVFLAQANPSNRRPMAVSKKQRLEKKAKRIADRVLPQVRK